MTGKIRMGISMTPMSILGSRTSSLISLTMMEVSLLVVGHLHEDLLQVLGAVAVP